MKKMALALALSLLGMSATADNLRGWYAGGGATRLDTGVSTDSSVTEGGSLDFTTLEGFGGYKFAWYLGGELRVGTGVTSDSVTANLIEYDASISHYESVYYRMESTNQVAKLYGLLGFSNVGLTYDGDDGDYSDSGLSYGFGIGFITGVRTNLNFEYRILLENGDNKFETFGINMDYRF